ncbi:hypothetical protein [Vibrio phage vB_pir03]|nr:hypothetical protein [Vibrio phage vB_pir03]
MYDKRYFILNADFETNGFNGAQKDKDNNWILGQQHHAIMEGAFQLVDASTMEVLAQTERLVYDAVRIGNWNESTRDFHNKVHVEGTEPFMTRWETGERVSVESLEQELMAMLEAHIEEIVPANPRNEIQICLAARSVGFDRSFIDAQMPNLGTVLSHQMLDVSSIRLAIRMFHPTMTDLKPGAVTHNAMDDCEYILGEIDLIRQMVQAIDTDKKYLSEHLEGQQA